MKRQRKISILLLSLFLSYGPINSLLLGKNLSVYQQEDQDYSVIVNLKLIQVFVTDKDGNPILDLTKSDFILRDNGKVQNITDFEKHELGKISLLTEERSEPEISSRMNRKFLILLDILGTDNVGVIQSKEAAIHFVETQLLPWDEVGIISYAPLTGLNIHTYFTTDRKRIIDAIKNAKEVAETKWEGPSMEQVRDQSVADAFNKPRSSGGGSQGFGGDSMVTSQFVRPFRDPGLSNIKKNPVHLIMDISELSKTLRYIPGVKHILFFSGGGHQKLQKFYLRLGMELAGANCLVHTINAMGERSNLLGWNRPSWETLQTLAISSGGKYFEDVRDYESIADDIQNFSGNYYVLGYPIDEKWDGRYHKIEVDVNHEEYRVYAQGGYFNPKPFSQFSEFEKKLHLIDLVLSDKPYFQDPVEIPVSTLPCSHSSPANCVLLSRLPLEFFEGKPGQSIEVFNIVSDAEKNIVDSSRGEFDYADLQKTGVFQYAILSLPPGQFECRVALRNLATGKGAFGSCSVTIPHEQRSGLALYSPLLLIPEKGSKYLKLSLEKENPTDKENVSLAHIYPFLSVRHSPLIHKMDKQVRQIMAVLRYSAVELSQPKINLQSVLVNTGSGDKMPLALRILASKQAGGAGALLIGIDLPPLKSGSYLIEFTAREKITESISMVSKPLIIE